MQSENDCVIPGTIFSYFNSTRVKLLFFCCKIITRKLTDVCALILLVGDANSSTEAVRFQAKCLEPVKQRRQFVSRYAVMIVMSTMMEV